MTDTVFAQAVEWMNARSDETAIEVTFHGGEPLTAGIQFYRRAFRRMRDTFGATSNRISIQSNLWLINPVYLDLFQEYQVHLGTSLDGPEEINDRQRGAGYFRRTMEKLNQVRVRGLSSGCIATLTAWSAPRWREILRFFENERLNVSIHAAIHGFGKAADSMWLQPLDFGRVMGEIFEYTLHAPSLIEIEPIASICRGFSTQCGGICTFGDCLGKFLAVGPDGGIYPCQRFIGMRQFQLGDVWHGTDEELKRSPAWLQLSTWREKVAETCAGCVFQDVCHGGCPYHALVSHEHALRDGARDPFCPAYHSLFSAIVNRAAAEFFCQENLEAIVEEPEHPAGLFRHGMLLSRLRSETL